MSEDPYINHWRDWFIVDEPPRRKYAKYLGEILAVSERPNRPRLMLIQGGKADVRV